MLGQLGWQSRVTAAAAGSQCQEELDVSGVKASRDVALSRSRSGGDALSLCSSHPMLGCKAGELPGFSLLATQNGALEDERHCRDVMGGLGCGGCQGRLGREMVSLASAWGGEVVTFWLMLPAGVDAIVA